MGSSNKNNNKKKKKTNNKKNTTTKKVNATTTPKKKNITTNKKKTTTTKAAKPKTVEKLVKVEELKETKVEESIQEKKVEIEKSDLDVVSHVRTIFEEREEEKKSLKRIKIVLLLIILCFAVLFGADLLTNKNRFKKVSNPEKGVKVKLEVAMKIEDYVGKNEKLSDFYLNLMGYGNSNQVTHPKVLRFDKKWNGYKYWVAYTPYPYGNAAKENPFIMVSNDLVNWKTMNNFENPLDEPEDKDASKVYNSDTHLVYIEEKNTLECYWRYVNDKTHKVIIYKRTTKDGVNWSEKEIVLENDRTKTDYLSPAIMYKDKKYLVWYVDRDLKIKYQEYDTTEDQWSEKKEIKIDFASINLKPWHLDVIETDKGYEAIIVAFSKWENRAAMSLYYSKSTDNDTWTKPKEILKPNNSSGIYRSSILYINNTYYIFYSDIVKKARRGVGIVYGSDISKLNGLQSKNREKFIEYIKLNG